MQFPIGVFGVAIGTASIPVLSRMASEGKFKDFRNTLSSSLNLVFLMTLPSACGLIVLGEPIIRLIYERGKFDADDTAMTAYALAGYSIGLTGYAAIKVLSPAFYALDDAKTPMIIALGSIVVNALASLSFSQLAFERRRFARISERFRSRRRGAGDFERRARQFFRARADDAKTHLAIERQRNFFRLYAHRRGFGRDVGGLLFQILFSAHVNSAATVFFSKHRMFRADCARRNRVFRGGKNSAGKRNRQAVQCFRAKIKTRVTNLKRGFPE